MIKTLLSTAIFFLCTHPLLAQTIKGPAITVNGYISDAATGERLAGASVYTLTDKSGSSSNAYGYFSLKLGNAGQSMVVNMLGYLPDTLSINALKDTTLQIRLIAKTAALAEVTITSELKRNLDISQMNKVGLSPAEIKALPRFAGEVDVVKALQLMPGIRAGKEGSGDFHVRGGGPDQNLVLLDGVPIYNSAHSLGLFSVFNADAIKNVELIKGGFPSRYGGRLSSVMDIRLKDGNNDHFRYDFSLGLISSRLLLEGPLKNENTTFMIGVRRTYLDLVASLAQSGKNEKGTYNFYDLNAKISHRFNEKDRLYFSVYSGNDRLGSRYKSDDKQSLDKNSIGWGNITSALRYNHLFSNKLFSNLTLTYTNYQFGISNSYKDNKDDANYELKYSSKIDDAGFKMDFDYIPSNNHFIRFGSNVVSHSFRPNVTSLKMKENGVSLADTAFNNNNIRALEYFLYAEDDIRLSDRLQVNAGLHFSGFYVQQKNYFSLQPRLSLNYLLTESAAVRGSYSQMSQYIHLLTATGSGSPADIWVPSTKKIAPQSSWQTTAGFAKTLLNDRYEINLDGFYKEMKHVIEYQQGAAFLDEGSEDGLISESTTPFEDKVVAGQGSAYGTELLFRKKEGKTSGWLAYTLSWSDRKLPGINNDQTYPYSYDSRHNLSLVLNHKLSKGIRLSGTWVYNSGVPATIPLSQYMYYDESTGNYDFRTSIENVDVRNNIRMRSYNRLDLGISFIKQKKRGERSWNISMYNVYNRKNPYFIQAGDKRSDSKTEIYQFSLLPVLPSFSYSYSFK
ncbi:MAG TPA: TonB-dependent receptor [Daejeonella sp.]|nr:TonB-dependent receptor [Daejeonella sp.]